MPIALRVLVSDSTAYPPTRPIVVNSSTPTKLSTGTFEGEISVWIKDYSTGKVDDAGEGPGAGGSGGDGHEYFGKRTNMTYGIVVRGRFLDDPSAEQVVFGNVFERPIRDSLPWGTSVAVKFMNWVDPTLELDIYADKPWALSPALAGMTNLSLRKSQGKSESDAAAWVDEDTAEFVDDAGTDEKSRIAARRRWFGDKAHREGLRLGDVQVGMEFANGLLDFNMLSATLPPPFHLSVPLLKYWEGSPVTYVCRRRSSTPVSPEGVYWSVGFEIVDEQARADLEKRGGKVLELTQMLGQADKADRADNADKAEPEATSDDVD